MSAGRNRDATASPVVRRLSCRPVGIAISWEGRRLPDSERGAGPKPVRNERSCFFQIGAVGFASRRPVPPPIQSGGSEAPLPQESPNRCGEPIFSFCSDDRLTTRFPRHSHRACGWQSPARRLQPTNRLAGTRRCVSGSLLNSYLQAHWVAVAIDVAHKGLCKFLFFNGLLGGVAAGRWHGHNGQAVVRPPDEPRLNDFELCDGRRSAGQIGSCRCRAMFANFGLDDRDRAAAHWRPKMSKTEAFSGY